MKQDKSKSWYSNGLHFKCTECGKCCSGSPGYVWVSEEEVKEMANYLKMEIEDFKKRFIRHIRGKMSLKELGARNYECVFLKDKLCQVYAARPLQCRTYPFWPTLLKNKETWTGEARYCEGIRDSHPKVEYDEIVSKLRKHQ